MIPDRDMIKRVWHLVAGVSAGALILSMMLASCRGGGANPSDADLKIPFVQPTMSSRICRNDEYPSDAPQFNEVSEGDYRASSGGVEHFVIAEGEGVSPGEDWRVTVRYTGWLEDGCIFGTTYLSGQDASFFVAGVIPGWREAMQEMKIGERRRIKIAPELAYGAAGSPPRIPPNATLIFDISLMSALEPADVWATATAAAGAAYATATAVSEEVAATVTAIAQESEANATAETEMDDTELLDE